MESENQVQAPLRPRRRSLRDRLLIGAVLVLAPLLVGAVLSVGLLIRSSIAYSDLAREFSRETGISVTLLQRLNAAEDAGSRYMDGGESDDLREFRALQPGVDRQLDPRSYDEGPEMVSLASIRRAWNNASALVNGFDPAQAGVESKGLDPEDRFEDELDTAIAGVERLLTDSDGEMSRDLVAAQQSERRNVVLGVSALALALLVAFLLARRFSGTVVRPLAELSRAARSLGSGHLGHRIALDSPTRELNNVADTFNQMAAALEQQRGELEHHAFSDTLTGVANRAVLEDRLRHALASADRTGMRIGVLVLDLDGFKLVNDGLGHASGDALLVEAAARMTACLRSSDTLARLGGDEFAVVLEDVRGLDDSIGAAERLRAAINAPFAIDGSEVLVSASVGIAMSSSEVHDGAELLRRADLAMYRAKARGKDGAEIFDPEIDDLAAQRLDTLNALRGAVERQELVAHYQPILDLETGELRAAEALMRWERPGHGLIPPLQFIPLAEQSGLIVKLGAWILREACREAVRWDRDGGREIPVTVNVSARQLLDPAFELTVASALKSAQLAPARLVLEVTESMLMQDTDEVVAKLARISRSGVRIALDDFGEGYSSLGQLRELPIDMLKIARPFVDQLDRDDRDVALVRGVIELAKSLGLTLVAEGIEHADQHAILRDGDCPLGQGFLFAKPMRAEDFAAFTRELPVAGGT